MKRVKLCAWFVTAVALTATGCGVEPDPEGTPQGVQITKQTEMDLRVVAASGEAKVSIIAHRLGLRPPEYVMDPSIESPYDADLIVQNRYGYAFLTSGNTGLPIDPDTGDYPKRAHNRFEQQEQVNDLQLAIDTLEQMRSQSGVGETFHGELRSLYYMAVKAIDGANDGVNGTIVPETSPSINDIDPSLLMSSSSVGTRQSQNTRGSSSSDEDVALATAALSPPYTHTVTIWSRPIWWTAWQGDHSAVLLRVFDANGTFVRSVSTRNHGLEASDPLMYIQSTGCPKSWGGRANEMPPLQPYVSTDLYRDNDAGGCSTSYNANPIMSSGHVCNDDSAAEYWNVKNNYVSVYAICNDSSLNYHPPACD